jgi:hypothetical protein
MINKLLSINLETIILSWGRGSTLKANSLCVPRLPMGLQDPVNTSLDSQGPRVSTSRRKCPPGRNLTYKGFVKNCSWKFSNIKCVQLPLGFKNVERLNSQDLRILILTSKDSQWKTERQVLELCHFHKENKIDTVLMLSQM